MFYSLNTVYAVPTTKCSDAIQKIGTVAQPSSLAHIHKQKETTANTRQTLAYPLSSHSYTVDKRTCIGNIHMQPALEFGPMHVILGQSQNSYNGKIRVFGGS